MKITFMNQLNPTGWKHWNYPASLAETKPIIECPYCQSCEIIKKGKRHKIFETVQLYLCQRCERKFTPLINKHRSYPLRVILDAVTLYDRFHSLEETAKIVSGSYGISVRHQTVANWLKDFKEYLPILKIRGKLLADYDPRKAFVETRLLHGQVYDFKCHMAKLDYLINRSGNFGRFLPFKYFLESIPKECPHELFRRIAKTENRSSRYKNIFNLDQLKIVSRQRNAATQIARLSLQAVGNNKLRHQKIQEFMLANDSATVAVEVPVILTGKDVRYFQNSSRFDIPLSLKPREAITGHIDVVQIRNGAVHILDYKPGAKREKPIEQLTIYALALSCLTGLRLFDFKCAWFDENDYFEFYPLHVVYKRR
jgi:transposase-like protein